MLRENLLNLECEVVDGVGLMRMEGELIAESRYEPERILREWLEADICKVIIQFDKVTHIDSAGLSTLLGALHRYRRQEGDLILARLNPSLNAIFEVTSMRRYFKIFDNLESARKHFKPPPPPRKKAAAKRIKKNSAVKKKSVIKKKAGAKKKVGKKKAGKQSAGKKKARVRR